MSKLVNVSNPEEWHDKKETMYTYIYKKKWNAHTHLPWFRVLNKSWITIKSGLMSGSSAQHCLIILIASGGAAPLLTDGRMRGGGCFTFSRISVQEARKGKENEIE